MENFKSNAKSHDNALNLAKGIAENGNVLGTTTSLESGMIPDEKTTESNKVAFDEQSTSSPDKNQNGSSIGKIDSTENPVELTKSSNKKRKRNKNKNGNIKHLENKVAETSVEENFAKVDNEESEVKTQKKPKSKKRSESKKSIVDELEERQSREQYEARSQLQNEIIQRENLLAKIEMVLDCNKSEAIAARAQQESLNALNNLSKSVMPITNEQHVFDKIEQVLGGGRLEVKNVQHQQAFVGRLETELEKVKQTKDKFIRGQTSTQATSSMPEMQQQQQLPEHIEKMSRKMQDIKKVKPSRKEEVIREIQSRDVLMEEINKVLDSTKTEIQKVQKQQKIIANLETELHKIKDAEIGEKIKEMSKDLVLNEASPTVEAKQPSQSASLLDALMANVGKLKEVQAQKKQSQQDLSFQSDLKNHETQDEKVVESEQKNKEESNFKQDSKIAKDSNIVIADQEGHVSHKTAVAGTESCFLENTDKADNDSNLHFKKTESQKSESSPKSARGSRKEFVRDKRDTHEQQPEKNVSSVWENQKPSMAEMLKNAPDPEVKKNDVGEKPPLAEPESISDDDKSDQAVEKELDGAKEAVKDDTTSAVHLGNEIYVHKETTEILDNSDESLVIVTASDIESIEKEESELKTDPKNGAGSGFVSPVRSKDAKPLKNNNKMPGSKVKSARAAKLSGPQTPKDVKTAKKEQNQLTMSPKASCTVSKATEVINNETKVIAGKEKQVVMQETILSAGDVMEPTKPKVIKSTSTEKPKTAPKPNAIKNLSNTSTCSPLRTPLEKGNVNPHPKPNNPLFKRTENKLTSSYKPKPSIIQAASKPLVTNPKIIQNTQKINGVKLMPKPTAETLVTILVFITQSNISQAILPFLFLGDKRN